MPALNVYRSLDDGWVVRASGEEHYRKVCPYKEDAVRYAVAAMSEDLSPVFVFGDEGRIEKRISWADKNGAAN
jgi:hypothetical protein